jgi:hypothetical protein
MMAALSRPVVGMRKLFGFFQWLKLVGARARRPAGPKPYEEMTDSDWVRHRAPTRHRDAALSDAARSWMQRLPEQVAPNRVCSLYPRIANRLAFLWPDPGLTEHFLDELLVDRRDGRQGFPPDVTVELLTLHRYNSRRLYVTPTPEDA